MSTSWLFRLKHSGLAWLWISALVFALDFTTKQWVLQHLSLHETESFLPFLQFTYVQNYGVAFGQLTEQHPWLLMSIAGAIAAYLLFWLWQNPRDKILENIALVLVVGGAVGNLYDRMVYGYVIDFIDFYVGSWHWYVFNVADSAICVGACLLLLEAFRQDVRH